jgi:hypothetical protein
MRASSPRTSSPLDMRHHVAARRAIRFELQASRFELSDLFPQRQDVLFEQVDQHGADFVCEGSESST